MTRDQRRALGYALDAYKFALRRVQARERGAGLILDATGLALRNAADRAGVDLGLLITSDCPDAGRN